VILPHSFRPATTLIPILTSRSRGLTRSRTSSRPVGPKVGGRCNALGHKAEVLAQLKPMKDRVLSLPQPEAPNSLLDASAIRSAIEGKMAGFRKNLIIAIAHDDYANISGGTQLSIRAEEAAAMQDGHFYLGVWPTLPLPCLSMEPDPLVDLRFNGIRLGTARCTALIAAMTACPIGRKAGASCRASASWARSRQDRRIGANTWAFESLVLVA
jgi:hypothetical protein